MKRIAPFIFILTIILSGCGSSKKQLQKGNYDAAIGKAVKQLRKDPTDIKQIEILNQSYKVANDRDNERVRFLKMEGRPNNWDEIYMVYSALSNRQSLVRTVTPLSMNGRSVDFPYVDYMPEMVNAKRKAADFYFAHGNELMKSNIKESYREAFMEFIRAKEYVAVSPDQTVQRDSVIKRAVEDGFTYVLDNKGSVMRDTSGNDIKLTKYKTLQCALVETIQSKACRIDGDVEVIQMTPDKVLKKDPIGAQSNFEHISSRALGDTQALNAKQLERTKTDPAPFSTDIEMVVRCSETLKMAIRGAIQNNRRFIF